MSACCLSVYAKSPGLAMDGVVRRNCAGEKRRRELASEGRLWKGCGSRDLYDDERGKGGKLTRPAVSVKDWKKNWHDKAVEITGGRQGAGHQQERARVRT